MSTYEFPYLEWRQSAEQNPTDWEMALSSAIEAAFGKGCWELDALVTALNESRVRPREGGAWTPEKYQSVMRELGA